MNTPKIIGFLSNKLTLRGTEVALYDYAHYNEVLLSNKSIIITHDFNMIKSEYDVEKEAYDKFKSRFGDLYYYNNTTDIDNIVLEKGITHLYIIKYGHNDGIVSKNCKNIIHCVFDSTQPHSDVSLVVGQTINDIFDTNLPVLHHIVTLPDITDDLRNELNIPKSATVFGRYGGKETFDIQYVKEVIYHVSNMNKNIYFIFMNTNIFVTGPNIKYISGTSDLNYKRKFINTCDAMIHARFQGETFGLSCGEFAYCKKPVITYGASREREHINILGDKAILYYKPHELLNILVDFDKTKWNNYMDNNGYIVNCSPEKIMKRFNELCLNRNK